MVVKSREILNPNFKAILIPILTSLVIVMLFLFVVKNLINQVITQNNRLKEAKKLENILIEKEQTLNDSKTQLSQLLPLSIQYLPEENSALVVFPQLREKSLEEEVLIADFAMGAKKKDPKAQVEEVSKDTASLSFTGTGKMENLLRFISRIGEISPLVTVNSVDFVSGDENFLASFSLKAHWASYPKTIPAINDPIVKLTSEEISLLSSIKPVSTSSGLFPSGPYERTTPF